MSFQEWWYKLSETSTWRIIKDLCRGLRIETAIWEFGQETWNAAYEAGRQSIISELKFSEEDDEPKQSV